VTLGRAVGNRVIVESGLQADDLVIVDGFQKIGPGAPVAPVCWTDPAAGEDATSSDACTRRLGQLASVAAK
jgi:membrane fusion protein (multidrug efflux system)